MKLVGGWSINDADYRVTFDCPILAHDSWLQRKIKFANSLADIQSCDTISTSLRKYYKEKVFV